MNERGQIIVHLSELIEKSGLSKNKFCQLAQLEMTQLNRLLKNQITRFDADVLIRICDTLDRGVGDLLEYKRTNE
ncbi:MAG: helix-turn-helix transcriptional regulator [Lachnospiraceae bacterium]|nr:helix-turn-helix transcriptional regulator [Lachnospiraceae bacterium]